jgi:beta-glucanase (GH16 family)
MSVSTGTFCPVWEDDFSHIDPASWSYEIQRGGFGTGSFDWTTDDPKNSYTDAEGLHIVPTLTTETTNITPDQIYDGYRLNLTTDKTCTSPDYTMCSIYSNKTTGDIINPVRSARMTTKGKRSIQYGKIEVVAKMPKGDWLWPAIWMMPEDDAYGPWPMSGEIDIAESRGNSPNNYTDGRNSIISALHWGPSPETDAFWRTSGKHNLRRTDYSEAFHTYGLEWTKDYLFMYIDNQLLVRLDTQKSPLPVRLANTDHSKCSSSSSPPGHETCGTAGISASTNPTNPLCLMLGPRPECGTRHSIRSSTSSST